MKSNTKTKAKRILCILLSLCTLLSFSSCALRVSAAGELTAEFERDYPADAAIDERFAGAAAGFGFDLFSKILTDGDNAAVDNPLFSPLSALLCLGMVASGADGQTLAEMEAAFGIDAAALSRSLCAYTEALPSEKDCRVSLADSVWLKEDEALTVKRDFLKHTVDYYDAEVYSAPFDDSTVKDVNAWCDDKTDGMIDKILDSIDPDAVMFLINALLFDAKWAVEYEKDDIREDYIFRRADGTRGKVDMMFSEENVWLEGDGFTGFAKNYKGDAYSFVGILPDEGADARGFAASMTGKAWLDAWENREYTPVEAGIPSFEAECGFDLVKPLSALGMGTMFSANADFRPMAEVSDANICVGDVLQKTFIEVSPHGTKAAAITIAVMDKCTAVEPLERKVVVLDRPFVYAIVDNATGLPLFVGVVTSL